MGRKRKNEAAGWETVRKIAAALPGAVEGTSYGTPAFHVDKKLFVRFHQSGESVVIMIHINEREALMKIDPETFYITNHYLNYPAMLVRLSTVQPDDLRKLIVESWRRSAPAKLVAAFEGKT
ncbi:MAG: MmcQ/YjbR family DNA-binding protein [Blastocatellia bacterium]